MCKWVKSGNQRIDPCMKETIAFATTEGYKTLACCCGHDRYEYTIIAKEEDGTIRELDTGIIIPRTKRFYCRDSEGHFYIPEIEMWRWIGFVLSNFRPDTPLWQQAKDWVNANYNKKTSY